MKNRERASTATESEQREIISGTRQSGMNDTGGGGGRLRTDAMIGEYKDMYKECKGRRAKKKRVISDHQSCVR